MENDQKKIYKPSMHSLELITFEDNAKGIPSEVCKYFYMLVSINHP